MMLRLRALRRGATGCHSRPRLDRSSPCRYHTSRLHDPTRLSSCGSTVRSARRADALRPGRLDGGNVSARVPGEDLMVIKPSGIGYDDLTPETWWSATSTASGRGRPRPVQRHRDPRLRLPAHARGRRGRARALHLRHGLGRPRRAIPCVLTAMADEFGGEIPVGPFALIGDDDIGKGIVETLAGHRSPAVLMRNHGVFTIGRDARDAVKAAVMCEDVARTAHLARALGHPLPMSRRTSTPSTTATRTSTASADRNRRARATGGHRHRCGRSRRPPPSRRGGRGRRLDPSAGPVLDRRVELPCGAGCRRLSAGRRRRPRRARGGQGDRGFR